MIDIRKLGSAMAEIIRGGALEDFVIEELKYSYDLCMANDWETKDAIRKVLKYYLSEPEYQEFIKEVGIENDHS